MMEKTGLNNRASFLFLASLFFITALVACEFNQEQQAFSISGPTMGTTYNITVVAEINEQIKVELEKEIANLLSSLNQQMSTYIDDSDILSFNRLPINTPKKIKQDFLNVILLSQEISALSAGHFDITIGPLVELWGFGKNDSQKIPSKDSIQQAVSRVGWQSLLIDEGQQTISKSKEVWLDVSAVAKGYAVDKIYDLLELKAYSNYLVEIGGEMRVKGLNREKKKWRIGIETPSLFHKQAQQLIQFTDASIATSGDYRNFFEENGERFSHTIDPETGLPVKHKIASVTVISDSAARADAMATALNVLGEEKALALAEKENLAAYFILYTNYSGENMDYQIIYTDSFKQYIQ